MEKNKSKGYILFTDKEGKIHQVEIDKDNPVTENTDGSYSIRLRKVTNTKDLIVKINSTEEL